MGQIKIRHFYFRIIILLIIGFSCSTVDAQRSFQTKIDSVKLLMKEDLPADTLGAIYSNLGSYYYKCDSLVQAIIYRKKAAAIYLENNNLEKYIQNLESIGVYYSFMNDYKQSLKYFLDALAILDRLNSHSFDYYTLIQNIGITYVEAEDAEKGIPFLNKSMEFFEKDTLSSNREGYLIVNYIDLGSTYNELNVTDSAFLYFSKALSAAKKFNITEYSGGVLVNLGDLYGKLKVYDKSKSFYEQARNEFKKNHDDRGYWHTIYGLAVDEKSLGNTAMAIQLLDSTTDYFKKSGDLEYLRDAYNQLSKIYEGQNEISKAFAYYKLCSEIKDSIVISDKKNKMTELQMQYELQKTEIENTNELALMQKENQLKIYKVYIIIGILIIGILFILLYLIRLRTKKRLMESKFANSQLEQKHLINEIEYKNKELENFALHIVHKNDFLDNIKTGLAELKDSTDKDNRQKIKSLSMQITQSLRRNKDLEKFQEKIDQVHGSFIKHLSVRFPDLTEKEKQLCVLLKLNLSSKEIATLNNISENAVVMARYRMRKKMGLNSEENLTEFIQKMN